MLLCFLCRKVIFLWRTAASAALKVAACFGRKDNGIDKAFLCSNPRVRKFFLIGRNQFLAFGLWVVSLRDFFFENYIACPF